MNIAQQNAMPSLDSIVSDIERYGLAQNAVELMTYGFTVVPPTNLGVTEAWIERLRDAAVTAYETRNDVSIDYRTSKISTMLYDLFYDEDEVFIEASTNAAKLALVRLVLGQGAVLRHQVIFLKGPAADAPADSTFFTDLALHTDQDAEGIHYGAGQICHRLNCTWILTDQVDEADGSTVFVPASHHLGHCVLPHDSERANTPYPLVRLEAKAGSVAMWQGATFHSALPRTRSGLRISLNENYTRPWVHGPTAEGYMTSSPKLTPELLDRHPELRRVLGLTPEQQAFIVSPRFDPYA